MRQHLQCATVALTAQLAEAFVGSRVLGLLVVPAVVSRGFTGSCIQHARRGDIDTLGAALSDWTLRA